MENLNECKIYIIEHMEEFLYDWCVCEYMQMLKYLHKTKSELIITNANKFLIYSGLEKEKNDQNIKQLNLFAKSPEIDTKLSLFNETISNYIFEEKEGEKKKKYLSLGDKKIDFTNICLMDLRGKSVLNPKDKNNFQVFIFGGILGDHPPRDRTSSLRKEQFELRHLGNIQLATDTAVLVSRLIINNEFLFDNIPFVDEPEVKDKNQEGIETSIVMEGFRYVLDSYQWKTGLFEENKGIKNPLIHPKIREMLFEELDFSKF